MPPPPPSHACHWLLGTFCQLSTAFIACNVDCSCGGLTVPCGPIVLALISIIIICMHK